MTPEEITLVEELMGITLADWQRTLLEMSGEERIVQVRRRHYTVAEVWLADLVDTILREGLMAREEATAVSVEAIKLLGHVPETIEDAAQIQKALNRITAAEAQEIALGWHEDEEEQ